MGTKKNRRDFMRIAAGLPPGILLDISNPAAAANEQPLSSATAVWHMEGPHPSGVQIHGEVSFGVKLQGVDLAASKSRGGDGAVADFQGGYLTLGNTPELDFSGKKAMTLCLRVRDPEGTWNVPLLSHADRQDEMSGILYPARANRQYLNYQCLGRLERAVALEFLWGTRPLPEQVKPAYFQYELSKQFLANKDWVAGVLRLQVPVELIGLARWHDIIIRFAGPNLQLFVDGVLVDEEWPYGALDNFRGPFLLGAGMSNGSFASGFYGQVDHLALWDRALDDDEVASLSGGRIETRKRALEFFGPAQKSLQYWRPQGFNTYAGDCMPAYYDGEFHLHYLFDRRHHHSKWGMGAHQFAHASSKDLISWTHHPMSVRITQQWECSIGTGCVVPHGKIYRAFYIQHQRRCWFKDAPFGGDTIHEAKSSDGFHFEKDMNPVVPWIYLRRKDGSPGDVNPDVFRPDARRENFYMSVSGEKMYVSLDLENWSEAQGFDLYKDVGKGICGSYFYWNGWYYFVASGEYRMSREPMRAGWVPTKPDYPATRDGSGVPKVAEFGQSRYLMVGFLAGTSYAGEVVFRELIQREDGTLGTKWPAEMIPKTAAPLNLPFSTVQQEATLKNSSIRVNSARRFALAALDGVPQDVRITGTIAPRPGASAFGLCVRGDGAYTHGCEIRFVPGEQRVCYGLPVSGPISSDARGHNNSFPMSEIRNVTGLDRSFTIDLVVKHDFVDTCIDGQRTLISRLTDRPRGARLFFFVDRGEVTFEDLKVRPIIEAH